MTTSIIPASLSPSRVYPEDHIGFEADIDGPATIVVGSAVTDEQIDATQKTLCERFGVTTESIRKVRDSQRMATTLDRADYIVMRGCIFVACILPLVLMIEGGAV